MSTAIYRSRRKWRIALRDGALVLVMHRCIGCHRVDLCVAWYRTLGARKPKYFCAERCWPSWFDKLQELEP